jgi:DNA modification methylase
LQNRLTDRERAIVDVFLASPSYKQAAITLGVSVGTVWAAVVKAGARKKEQQIRLNAASRAADREKAELFDSMIGTSVTADVLDYLRSVPDDSVKMFLTSIPYNVGKAYGGVANADRERFMTFRGFLMMTIDQMARSLAPGGVVFLQVGLTRDDAGSRIPLDILLFDDLRNCGLTYQSRVVWPAHHGLTPKRRLAERYETALVFSKGEATSFNPNAARRPQLNPGKRAFHGPNKGRLSGHPLGSAPSDHWDDVKHLGHNHRELTEHVAQFPEALAMRAILLYTEPGQLVVDPFAGSGTTLVAARRAGRAFSGCDLFYEDLRARRLAAAAPDRVSILPGVSPESIAVWSAEAHRRDVPATPITAEEDEQLILEFC